MSNIPSSPLLSLVDFSDANLGTMAEDPFKAVGNSEHSAMISPIAPYGIVQTAGGAQTIGTGIDLSWLLNDALFDRYFLSGIVPEYDHNETGNAYRVIGSLNETLDDFYGVTGTDYKDSQASPVLAPYVPTGKTAEEVIDELTSTSNDGYKKMAAYSMLKGGFNINCTDANAWARFLRGTNNDIPIKFTNELIDERSIPGLDNQIIGYLGFPSSSSLAPPSSSEANNIAQTWSGYSRLTLAFQINNMATAIADEVKKRGPFMSVSDFVNHKVGGNLGVTNQHRKGAIQAAIDTMVAGTTDENGDPIIKPFNDVIAEEAGGVTTEYGWQNTVPNTTLAGNSAMGIPGTVTQANVLRVLAPRLTARSDTFRIRAYGEVRDADGNIIAKATCEAIVQRLPEYVDSNNNEPWDEGATLNTINQTYGRRFEIRSFRWLDESEV
jgi:hypothetical protein